ncbi:hypothetical protein UBN69_06980 [Helicobacter pylori]
MLAAYGAYTGVGMLASTAGGVEIAELSGVAATNATLCLDEWWGDFFGRWVGCYGVDWRGWGCIRDHNLRSFEC